MRKYLLDLIVSISVHMFEALCGIIFALIVIGIPFFGIAYLVQRYLLS